MLQFLKKLKLYTKWSPETVQYLFLLNLSVITFISPPFTKSLFTKERHIDDSLVKPISLSENTPDICQIYCFSFFLSDNSI